MEKSVLKASLVRVPLSGLPCQLWHTTGAETLLFLTRLRSHTLQLTAQKAPLF
jgi:hypothetical protein